MSWLQWAASWIVTFVVVVFCTCLLLYLVQKSKAAALEVIDYYLARKKAIIAELEEELEEAGKKKSIRSNYN